MGGAGLGAVSSYSVKFQVSELISSDFSQRQFARSSVNLTSSNKIEERDCCFAYWFVFLLHTSSLGLWCWSRVRLCFTQRLWFSHFHTYSLFHFLLLISFPSFPPALDCVCWVEDAVFAFITDEFFPELISNPMWACTASQRDLRCSTKLCKAW